MLNEENQIQISYCVFVRTLVIQFYYSSGTITNYSSGLDFYASYSFRSTRQKVKVPKVTVPQYW
jgi:hypothetical protein